jgi:hypothetical protein
MGAVKPLALLCALAAAASAFATTALPASVEELARASDAVVRGRVAQVTARWTPDHLRIFSYAEIEPSSVLRGAAPGRVTVMTPGGVADGLGQRVDGMAVFTPGEEVVVFLSREVGGRYVVKGHAQGKFAISGGTASPDLSHVDLVPAPIAKGERRAEPMAVSELERRVRSAR